MRCCLPGSAFILVAAMWTPLAGQEPARAELVARIDSIVSASMTAAGAPGISIGVVRGTDTIALKGYGLADVENDVAVTDRSVFRIGSITKQFTSAAVMRLVEQGRVRLDAPLSEYLPEFEGPGRIVTIHQLLNHTSGIPSYTALGEEFWSRSRLDLTHEQMLDLFAGDSLEFEPGSRWAYNNSGYYLLGMVIEKVTGESYGEHVRTTQFEPLGLTQTLYCHQAPIVPHRAAGYAQDNGRLINAPPLSMNSPGAAGALCSTARDLVRWTDALTGGRVVNADSYRRMTTATQLTGGAVQPYGYGLAPGRIGDLDVVQHGGGINGFNAFLSYVPSADLTVVVMANGATSAEDIHERISRAVLGLPQPAPQAAAEAPTEVPIDAAALERYTGTYDLAPAAPLQIRIFVADGRLVAQATGQGPLPLAHTGNGTFVTPAGGGIRLVFTVEGDRATSFMLHQGGGSIVARRIETPAR